MLNIDKITIINSFIQVVKLIKGVRNELSTDIDNLKQATKESSEIDDTRDDSLTTTFSAKKIKEFINDKINEFLQEDEEREAVIDGLLKQLTAKVANAEGLLSIDSQQTLTDEQKAQVLANLGINKDTLIKMLVDDDSVIDSNNLLSAKKISDMISDYVARLDSDEVFTDAEFEEYLQANAFVPKPNKPGQVLRARLIDGKLSIVWEDEVVSPPATTGTADTVNAPTREDTSVSKDTAPDADATESTGDTVTNKGEDAEPSVATGASEETEEREESVQPSTGDNSEAGSVLPAEEEEVPSADTADDTESETTVVGSSDGVAGGPGTESLPELTPGLGEGSGSYGD